MSDEVSLTQLFRLRFEQLKTATNRSPKTLITFVGEKSSFHSLARDLKFVADEIEAAGDFDKAHPQVSVGFIEAWKDYLYNWRDQVAYAAAWPLLGLRIDLGTGTTVRDIPTFEEYRQRLKSERVKSGPDPDWDEHFDPRKHRGGDAIADLIRWATDEGQNRRDNGPDDAGSHIANICTVGVEAFDYMETVIGIDTDRVFRRWNQIPAVFVPKHVSDKHGLTGRDGLYALLNEAIRAYVAGATAASVAMCRALLEIILRDHYLKSEMDRGNKASLDDVINLAAARYDFLNTKKMHRLRQDANRILHAAAAAEDDETRIIQIFQDLKYWIEKAPSP